jgi:hypothetical protein
MSETTHPEAGGQEPVFRLMYRSHSLLDDGDQGGGLGAIFTAARRNNRALDITGALMTSDDAFAQVLEGEESAVRELFARISADERHDHVDVLQEQAVPGRTFGRWAMARVSEDGGPDIRLLSHADRGAIVTAATDPSITPAQEEVLAVMRDAIAHDRAGS